MDLPKLVTGEAHNPVDVVGVGDSKWGIVKEENRRVTGTLAIQLSLGILLQVLVVVLAVNQKEKEKENKYSKKKRRKCCWVRTDVKGFTMTPTTEK